MCAQLMRHIRQKHRLAVVGNLCMARRLLGLLALTLRFLALLARLEQGLASLFQNNQTGLWPFRVFLLLLESRNLPSISPFPTF